VAISKDGTTLLATYFTVLNTSTSQFQANLLLSTDAGNTWSTVPGVVFDYPEAAFGLGVILQPLAISRNGTVMVAGSPNGQLLLSTDRGATFVSIAENIAAADASPGAPPPTAAAVGAKPAARATPGTVKVGKVVLSVAGGRKQYCMHAVGNCGAHCAHWQCASCTADVSSIKQCCCKLLP
jgi:hypothetical protein